MDAQSTTSTQPQAATQMNMIAPAQAKQTECKNANRIRGGGAGKDCFIGLVECFICFECCKGCCDCFADIICCPCEMCC